MIPGLRMFMKEHKAQHTSRARFKEGPRRREKGAVHDGNFPLYPSTIHINFIDVTTKRMRSADDRKPISPFIQFSFFVGGF